MVQQLDSHACFEPLGDAQGVSIYTPAALPAELDAATLGNRRAIPWLRPKGQKWPAVIQRALAKLERIQMNPGGREARWLLPDDTLLPGRARDGRARTERQHAVRREAVVNTCTVLAHIIGWTDLASGLVALPPAKRRRRGGAGWEMKAWADVAAVAFGRERLGGVVNPEKRTERAVARLAALGYVTVEQIAKRAVDAAGRPVVRARPAVKHVMQALWARLGLIKHLLSEVAKRRQDSAARAAAAREAVAHAGERARQRGPLPSPAQVRPASQPAGPPACDPAIAAEHIARLAELLKD